MSLSPRSSRILRAAPASPDAFVLDGHTRRTLNTGGPVASAEAIIAAAGQRAQDIVAAAEMDAERTLASARASAGAVTAAAREAGHADGYANGHAQAMRDAAALVDFIRKVAEEGRVLRDQVAAGAAPVVARATAYAVRRIVGEYYQQDPARTSAAVDEAIRAASGQQIVSIRVNPGSLSGIRAHLTDLDRYIVPDAAVEIGGCVVDLEGGTLDAGLDTRIRLIEQALNRAAGGGDVVSAFDAIVDAAATADVHARSGSVVRASGDRIAVRGANFRVHELAIVEDPAGRPLAAECSGVDGSETLLSLLDRGAVAVGARVHATGAMASAPAGPAVLGRVLDGLGRPIDGGPALAGVRWVPVYAEPPSPLDRAPIEAAITTGIRAVDGFLTLGRGQRVGIFAGSGVGKSTTMGMLARGTNADVAVIALIGERGREVRDFIEHDLGLDALRNAVVVASTGDNPAAMRLCAANAATAIAEGFRAEGRDVLLLFDSLTRIAMAQREIGLAAGEPPTTRGYPPSVFSLLPHLMERTGPGARGSITAVYTILVDGDDLEEPIADISRATLDGHVVLRRTLATAGHYPPIDVLGSVSRLMSRVAARHHNEAARRIRALLAAYEEARDLVSIGAYIRGSDPQVDAALDLLPAINAFLTQRADEVTAFDDSIAGLCRLAGVEGPSSDAVEADFVDPVDGDAEDDVHDEEAA